MKIAVLGTGMVGQAIAGRLDELGHDVVTGTRDVAATLARTEPEGSGTSAYATWQRDHPGVRLLPFSEAAAQADVVLNATAGIQAMAALEATGAEALAGKTLIDLALPLDFSRGMPPQLTVPNTDSLGEQIQRAFPQTHVVKTLNTVYKDVMIDPTRVPGPHNIFVSGDDAGAKALATGILREFGWPQESIIDLGGIATARGTEGYMALYFLLVSTLETFDFNLSIVRK